MSAFRTAAITDEFSPDDLDAALDGMAAVGMTGAELRVVGRRNMIDLSNEEVDAVRAAVEAKGMEVISLASPLLKCVLPGSPPLDSRVQHDVFGSPHTFEDQPALTRRAFEIAERLGAGIIRVFSFWRTTAARAVLPATEGRAARARRRGRRARRDHRPRERARVQRRHRRRGTPRSASTPTPRCRLLAKVPISLHCWQGDDVGGFEKCGTGARRRPGRHRQLSGQGPHARRAARRRGAGLYADPWPAPL